MLTGDVTSANEMAIELDICVLGEPAQMTQRVGHNVTIISHIGRREKHHKN